MEFLDPLHHFYEVKITMFEIAAGKCQEKSYPLLRLLIYPCPHSADSALCRENVICGSIDLVSLVQSGRSKRVKVDGP